MAYLLNLPREVLEYILSRPTISANDLLRLKATCSLLRDIVSNSTFLWKSKFLHRWPICLYRGGVLMDFGDSWVDIYKQRLMWVKKVRDGVEEAVELLLHKDPIPKCVLKVICPTDVLFSDEKIQYFIMDELYSILSTLDSSYENLSTQYYAKRLINILIPEILKRSWLKLAEECGGVDSIRLEQGLMIIYQWLQPLTDMRQFNMEEFLVLLCRKIAEAIKHFSQDIFSKVTDSNLVNSCDDKLWTESERTKIMETIVRVILSLPDCQEESVMRALKFFKLNDLLWPVITKIIVHRYHIHSDLMFHRMAPLKLLLRYVQHDQLQGGEKWTYVDMSRSERKDKKRFLSGADVQHTLLNPNAPASNIDIFRHIAETFDFSDVDEVHFSRNLAELKVFLSPENVNHLRRILAYYIQENINFKEIHGLRTKLISEWNYPFWSASEGDDMEYSSDDEYGMLVSHSKNAIKPKRRSVYPEIEFSIGMIMFHKRYHYCCVIYGWNEICQASNSWIREMGVHRLPKGPDQPFYHVLVSDGSNRYAAQENLQLHLTPEAVTHPLIGRYFESFHQTHYIPNHALAQIYPDDIDVTTDLCTNTT